MSSAGFLLQFCAFVLVHVGVTPRELFMSALTTSSLSLGLLAPATNLVLSCILASGAATSAGAGVHGAHS